MGIVLVTFLIAAPMTTLAVWGRRKLEREQPDTYKRGSPLVEIAIIAVGWLVIGLLVADGW